MTVSGSNVSLQHRLSSLSLSLFRRKAAEDTECGTDPPRVESSQQLSHQAAGSWASLRPRTCDRGERPSTWPHLLTWLSQPGWNVAGLMLCPPQVSGLRALGHSLKVQGSWVAPLPWDGSALTSIKPYGPDSMSHGSHWLTAPLDNAPVPVLSRRSHGDTL